MKEKLQTVDRKIPRLTPLNNFTGNGKFHAEDFDPVLSEAVALGTVDLAPVVFDALAVGVVHVATLEALLGDPAPAYDGFCRRVHFGQYSNATMSSSSLRSLRYSSFPKLTSSP